MNDSPHAFLTRIAPNSTISHHDIHHTGEANDENGVEEGEEIPLAGQGGHEEAGEGDAAEVGDGQGEQAPHSAHHLLHMFSYLILNLSCF